MVNMNKDHIFIRDLILEMSVGIYEHEKQKKQRVIINIGLDVETNAKKTTYSIDDVVSYEQIKNKVEALAGEKHYELLEEFAEKIAELCLLEEKVMSVKIKIEKPDIIHNTKSVGVSILRNNQ